MFCGLNAQNCYKILHSVSLVESPLAEEVSVNHEHSKNKNTALPVDFSYHLLDYYG